MLSLEFVACRICESVLKYDCKTTGSSHVKRHAKNCKPSESKKKQTLLTSHFNKNEVKLNDKEKFRRGHFDVKNVLYSRNIIALFAKEKVSKLKENLKEKFIGPQEAESVVITLDL